VHSKVTRCDHLKLTHPGGGKAAAAVHRDENVSDAIQSLPMPELVARPKKPKKARPSKNRVTQKKNDARHAAAVAEWETACAEISAENALLTSEWEAENKQHLKDARTKRGKPAVQKVYVAALKKLQDDYYEAVGKPCGLLRVGPRLARKSTKEYAADKRQAKRMAVTCPQETGPFKGEFVLVTFVRTRRTDDAQNTFHRRTDRGDFAGVCGRGESLGAVPQARDVGCHAV
jgi:hypothetical protein